MPMVLGAKNSRRRPTDERGGIGRYDDGSGGREWHAKTNGEGKMGKRYEEIRRWIWGRK